MTRKDFLKMCGILGISLPFQSALSSCDKEDPVDFSGKVLIIGAGAGGLSAGYLLEQHGIDFQILEASSVNGGRMKINTGFADFPIPLGAEWIETSPNVLQEIVNQSAVEVDVETIADDPDYKFVNYSWFNFFEDYIAPSVSNRITYNSIVKTIDYSGDQIIVNTQNQEYTADKVIVSVPLKILQDGDITFTPGLPQAKQEAIDNIPMWAGFKAFFEFSQNFYEDEYAFDIEPETKGQKIYYNAAFGQPTAKNILGLFVVGEPAHDYLSLSDTVLKDFILQELDGIYANQATPNYIKHLSQNWNNEPFIKAGYMSDHTDWKSVKKLGETIANKVYFAGGAYTDGEDWVSVHTAAQSARKAVEEMVG